jgi:hypothetical protein
LISPSPRLSTGSQPTDIETPKNAKANFVRKQPYRHAKALPSPIGEGPGVRPTSREFVDGFLINKKTPVSQSFREFLFKQNLLLKAVPILVS